MIKDFARYYKFSFAPNTSLTVDSQCHRSVIDKLHLHHRAETTGLHANTQCPYGIDKCFVQRYRDLRRRGVHEAGSPAFAAVAVKRELADNKNRSASRRQIDIHLPIRVFKDAKRNDLVRQPPGPLVGIVMRYTKQNQKPSLDLPGHFIANNDPSPADPLYDRTHLFTATQPGPKRIT